VPWAAQPKGIWAEQTGLEALDTFAHDRHLNVATFESARESPAAVFHEMNLDTGMAPLVLRNEIRQLALDELRRRAHAEQARLPALERACPLAQRFGIGEQAAAAPQQIFTLGGEANPPSDTVEQRHAQLRLERVNLPRGGRLGDIEPRRSAGNAIGVDDRGEGAEVTQVHRDRSYIFRINYEAINSLDTLNTGSLLCRPTTVRALETTP